MCGIAGVFSVDPRQTEWAVRRMNRSQAHRGPDDEGLRALDVPGGRLVLGHRRLSILDLSAAGHQPMQNPATGDWIVYNGEIYNYPQLRRQLEAGGARFRSRCDTEAILHAFAKWGVECFQRFDGMFAVAIYDRKGQRIVLARDPLGIKPLYYGEGERSFVFASELRAIETSGLAPDEIDRRALASLMAYGAVPGPLTLRKDVRLLDPGSFACLPLDAKAGVKGKLERRRYWDFPASRPVPERAEAVQRVRELLAEAARSHLLSDVPVGIFLSSGLDSTAVATLCAGVEPEAVSTFTVSLADHPELDENGVAEETARLLGAKHHGVKLSDDEVRRCVHGWLEALDQPSIDGLNTYIVARAVRERGIKVALSGLGGDEVFGGYGTFRHLPRLARLARLGAWLPQALRGRMAELVFTGKSKAQRSKARDLARTRPTLRNIYFRRRRLFSDGEMEVLGFNADRLDLNEDFLPPETEPDRSLRHADASANVGILESRFYMGNMLLRDSDVFGMAHGLEIRVPFLDRRLTDYVFSLPGHLRVARRRVNKPLLVDAMAGRLRAEILNLGKRGFGLPQAAWMAGPLRERFRELIETTRQSGSMAPEGVTATWEDFLRDRKGPTWSRAWLLGALGAWMDGCRKDRQTAADPDRRILQFPTPQSSSARPRAG